MTTYNVAIKKNPDGYGYFLYLTAAGDAAPGGTINLGTVNHDPTNVADNLPGSGEVGENHVLFHHARDVLYKTNFATLGLGGFFPNNITDMANVKIIKNGPRANIAGIKTTSPGATVAVGATRQLTTKGYTPDQVETAIPSGVSYVSSHPARATVNGTGLVTGVAAGAVTITATYEGKTSAVTLTVT